MSGGQAMGTGKAFEETVQKFTSRRLQPGRVVGKKDQSREYAMCESPK